MLKFVTEQLVSLFEKVTGKAGLRDVIAEQKQELDIRGHKLNTGNAALAELMLRYSHLQMARNTDRMLIEAWEKTTLPNLTEQGRNLAQFVADHRDVKDILALINSLSPLEGAQIDGVLERTAYLQSNESTGHFYVAANYPPKVQLVAAICKNNQLSSQQRVKVGRLFSGFGCKFLSGKNQPQWEEVSEIFKGVMNTAALNGMLGLMRDNETFSDWGQARMDALLLQLAPRKIDEDLVRSLKAACRNPGDDDAAQDRRITVSSVAIKQLVGANGVNGNGGYGTK